MKKILVVILILLGLLAFWIGEDRSFYCIDNKCITVWKTYNNTCYIIPYKYYGIFKPKDNFIITSNTNSVDIFFTAKDPRSIFIRADLDIDIYNNNKTEINILDYSYSNNAYDTLFYPTNATRFNEIKPDATLIELFIRENYAVDKNGIKI